MFRYLLVLAIFCTLYSVEGHGWGNRNRPRPIFDYGYALEFNNEPVATEHFVDISSSNFMSIGGQMTFALTIRPRAAGTLFYLSKPNGRHTIEIRISTSRRIELRITNSQGSATTATSSPINFNQWHYIVITVNSQRQVRFYREGNNGQLSDLTTTSLSFLPDVLVREIGQIGRNPSGNYWGGDIDALAFWGRVLTSSQMKRSTEIDVDDPTLVLYYNFDQGTGYTLTDLSSHQLHGSLGGGNNNRAPEWIPANCVASRTCRLFNHLYARTYDRAHLSLSDRTGDFWLSRSPFSGPLRDVAVQVRLNLRPGWSRSAVFGVAFQDSGNNSVIFDLDFVNRQDSQLKVNGVVVPSGIINLNSGTRIIKYFQGGGGRHIYEVSVPFVFSMKIKANPRDMKSDVYLRLVRDPYIGVMEGICGDNDGSRSDDQSTATWSVGSISLFDGDYDFYTSNPSTFTCDAQNLEQPLRSQVSSICGNAQTVDSDMQADCTFEVCASGDITTAVTFAEITYDDCIEDVINGIVRTCVKPCPNFCSFHGTCSSGVCACATNFGGRDCSQEIVFDCYAAKWSNGQTKEISPVIDSKSITSHYSYSSSSSNSGNTIAETTVMYLYEQRSASRQTNTYSSVLSFVLVNDKPRDGTGGSIRAEIATNNVVVNSNLIKVPDDSTNADSRDRYYVNSTSLLTARWTWDRCCTDGLALSPLPDRFCLNVSLSGLDGINQIVVAEQNQFGAQDLHSEGLQESQNGVSICGETCTNQCGALSDCGDCIAHPECGWCAETSTCEYGDPSGPRGSRCQVWRWSDDPTEGRVIFSDINYPVDPANIEVYHANRATNVSFYVNFPPLDDIPLDIMLLQDLSSSFTHDLCYIQATTLAVFDQIERSYPLAKLGIASFIDKPFGTLGSASARDFVYTLNQPLTTTTSQLRRALNSLRTGNGGDSENAQLEALYQVAIDTDVRWRDNARRIVVVITKTPFHESGDSTFPPNNGDDVVDGNPPGTGEDYPTLVMVRNALLRKNIIPIFISSSTHVQRYRDLVSYLGFGYASSFSTLSLGSIYAEALTALEIISSSVKVVSENTALASRVTPTSGYSGISPLTRTVFTVHLDGTETGTTTLVVPGFGSIDLKISVPDIPVAAQCPQIEVDAGVPVEIQLTGAAPFREPLTAVVQSRPLGGTLHQYEAGSPGAVISSDGQVITDPGHRVFFIPDGSQSMPSISYTLCDSCDICSSERSCAINVRFVNLPPTPVPIPPSLTMLEDGNATISLTGTDIDGTVATSTITVFPVNGVLLQFGTLALITPGSPQLTDGSFRAIYRPQPDRFGTGGPFDSFAYRLTDNRGAPSVAKIIFVTVNPVNDRPVAQSASYSTNEDTTLPITLIGTDAFGETSPLTYRLTLLPTHGILASCPTCGALPTGNLASNSIFYIPNADNVQPDSFRFTVLDSEFESLPATINIAITPMNDAPTTNVVGPLSIPEDTRTPITLGGSDIDVGDTLTVRICNWNGRGTLFLSGSPTGIGTGASNVIVPGGVIDYLSPPNEFGNSFTSFTFAVQDQQGASSPCRAVDINVTPTPDAPVVPVQDVVIAPEETDTVVTLRATDADNEQLTFTLCAEPGKGTIRQTGGASIALGNVITDVTFSPPETVARLVFRSDDSSGNPYTTFGFQVTDGNTPPSACTTVTIIVDGVNDRPVLTPLPTQTTNEDVGIQITLEATDVDSPTLTFRILSGTSFGQLHNGPSAASPLVVLNTPLSGAVVFFNPGLDNNGPTSFTYVANDGLLDSLQGTVNIQVNPVNDEPVANPQTVDTLEDVAVIFTLSGTDVETLSTSLTILIASPPVGTLVACDSVACGSTSPITLNTPLPSQTLRYTPPANANNGASSSFTSFTFYVRDASSADSAPATVTISVTPVNDPPQAVPGAPEYHMNENTPTALLLGGFDVDGDNLTLSIPRIDFLGSLFQLTPPSTVGAPINQDGQTILNSAGNVWYVPTRNENGTAPFTRINYRVDDGQAFVIGSVDIFVTNVDDPPIAITSSAPGVEDIQFSFDLEGIDLALPSDPLTVTIVTAPALGTLFQSDGITVISGTNVPVTSSAGTVQYIGALNGFGPAYTTFTYTVTGTHGTSAVQTVTISLSPVEDDPIAETDRNLTTTSEDVSFQFELSGSDPDGDTNLTAFVIPPDITRGRIFQVNGDGSRGPQITNPAGEWVTHPGRLIEFVPPLDFSGTTIIEYFLQDSTGRTSPLTQALVDIISLNDPPVGVASVWNGMNNVPSMLITLNFNDAEDGITLAGEITVLPTRGRLFRGDGSEITDLSRTFPSTNTHFTFEHEPLTLGTPYTTFSWRVFDSEGAPSAEITDTINIALVNNPPNPRLQSDTQAVTDEDVPVDVTLIAVDPEGDDVRFRITKFPDNGVLQRLISGSGGVYVPIDINSVIPSIASGAPQVIRYIPNLDYNNDADTPDTFQYRVTDVVDGGEAEWPFTETVVLIVNPVNDMPSCGAVVTEDAAVDVDFGLGGNLPASIVASIEDDALPVVTTVVATVTSELAETLNLVEPNPTGVTVDNSVENVLVLTGSVPALHNCLQNQILFYPSACPEGVPYPCEGKLTIEVNDQGSFGTGGVMIGQFTTNVTIHTRANFPGNLTPTLGAVSLVGVTTVVSVSIFAAYTVMKKKKLIPEEADPWDNDDLFDATLDNPLYSGATVTMSAVYEDEDL